MWEKYLQTFAELLKDSSSPQQAERVSIIFVFVISYWSPRLVFRLCMSATFAPTNRSFRKSDCMISASYAISVICYLHHILSPSYTISIIILYPSYAISIICYLHPMISSSYAISIICYLHPMISPPYAISIIMIFPSSTISMICISSPSRCVLFSLCNSL